MTYVPTTSHHEPVQQAALDRASQGATLGLLSMQERIRLAGGELKITSSRGRGTAVWVRFPLDGR